MCSFDKKSSMQNLQFTTLKVKAWQDMIKSTVTNISVKDFSEVKVHHLA